MTLTREQFEKSKLKANNLIEKLTPPSSEWNKRRLYLLRIKIIIEDLQSRGVITKKEAKAFEKEITPYVYRNIIDDPKLDDNGLKKMVKVSLINDWLKRSGSRLKVGLK